MRLIVFSVYDAKAGQFSRPFFSVAAGEALRSFEMECQKAESMLHAYPEDFHLHRLGEFDQVSGVLYPEAVPVVVCSARDFVRRDGLEALS